MNKVLSCGKPQLVDIQDTSHRVWILQDKTLIAVPRKHLTTPATIALISCRHVETLKKDRGNSVYLGLEKPKLCVFCEKVEEQPTLQLKEQNIMDLYHQPKPVEPFLFYHNQSGRNSTFESVAFPGWFIAVSSQGGSPLILTQELGKVNTTDFGITMH
ncbi:interleukin-36 alpha-like [Carlito syrichta]|uniref:Interleukin-1 n=1 Tax=Carlito syrichta TaxID=1868482 RepID=A0A1U7T7V7_CARSF|nr:interleukin-36 alpha-like [Carlito syrichta]